MNDPITCHEKGLLDLADTQIQFQSLHERILDELRKLPEADIPKFVLKPELGELLGAYVDLSVAARKAHAVILRLSGDAEMIELWRRAVAAQSP